MRLRAILFAMLVLAGAVAAACTGAGVPHPAAPA